MVVTRMLPCTISTYHYNLICDLVFISISVHLCSIIVVDRYFDHKLLGLVRAGAILVSFVLAGLLVARRNTASFPIVAPALCSKAANSTLVDDAAGYAHFIVVMAMYPISLLLATAHSWLTSPRRKDKRVVGRGVVWFLRFLAAGAALYIGVAGFENFLPLQHWMTPRASGRLSGSICRFFCCCWRRWLLLRLGLVSCILLFLSVNLCCFMLLNWLWGGRISAN